MGLGTPLGFWLSVPRRMQRTPLAWVFLLSCSLWRIGAADFPTAPVSTNDARGAHFLDVQAGPEEDVILEGLSEASEIEHNFDTGLAFARYGAVVRYGALELVANQVAMSQRTGDIIADGNIRLRNGGQYWTGEHVEYNYLTGAFRSGPFRAGTHPMYIEGEGLAGNMEERNLTITNAFVTTDDVKAPNYRIKGRQFRLRAGKTIEARNVTVYFGDTPSLYLPYFHRNLQQHRTFWRFTPGYRSLWGPYLLSSYNFPITTNIAAGVNIDLYEKRGVGLGPDLLWDFQRWGQGAFRYYYINDNEPEEDPAGNQIRTDRHRINFSHMMSLRPNLVAKAIVREQSDPFIVRDFFESEYRTNTQPRTFIEVNQQWSNWTLDLMAQPQINDFFQTVERLPDVKLSGIRQQIGATPLFYESETSLAYLRFRPGLEVGTNYAAMRGDSFHQVLWPQTYFGWLNFIPRVGGRFTQYGETDGADAVFDESSRFVFNTGAELSFKASRVWRGARNDLLDVHELRHIVEPSLNYVFVPEPNYRPRELPQFDREIPSLRLLPIDYPDYNAIDAIDSQNVLRLGLRNKLQTKRGEEIQNLVNWAAYTDWRLDPRDGQGTFSDAYSDLDFRPRSWLTLNSELRYDIPQERLQGSYHVLTLAPNESWSWRGGHLYFRGGPEFGPDSDNNTFFSSFYVKFNENWAARVSHHFEARDGVLEEQYYTVYRDFRSWTGALTFRLREPRQRPTEFAVAFTFQLKAFPRYGLGADRHEPSFLLGG